MNQTIGEKLFFKNAEKNKYFHFTNETIFEMQLLKHLMADIMFKHTSFRAFCDSYIFLHANKLEKRCAFNRKRITDAFYCLELVKYYSENDLKEELKSI